MSHPVALVLALLALPVCVSAWSNIMRSVADLYEKVFVLSLVVGGTFYQSVLLPQSSDVQLVFVAIAVFAAVNVRARPRGDSTLRPSAATGGFIVLAIWLVMFLVNAAENQGLDDIQVFGRLLPVALWICLFVIVSSAALDIALVRAAVVLAFGLVTIAGATVSTPSRPCDQFKCGVFGEIHIGAFASENYLGILCALAVVIGCAGFTERDRFAQDRLPLYTLAVATFVATSSRSSALAAICGLLVIWFGRNFHVEDAEQRVVVPPGVEANLIRTFGRVLPWLLGGIGLLLISSATDSSFSNRGAIWTEARGLLKGHELFGLGIGRWAGYSGVTEVSHHFPHSVYLMTYFSGGLVSLALLLALVASALKRARTTNVGLVAATAYATTLLICGLTEVVFNAMSIDGLSWMILPLLAQPVLRATVDPTSSASSTRRETRPRRGRSSTR